jgi:hypothetical protein
MVGFLSRDDWCIGGKHEVDSWVRDQVSLEFSNVHIQSTIKPQRGGQGGNDLELQYKKSCQICTIFKFEKATEENY